MIEQEEEFKYQKMWEKKCYRKISPGSEVQEIFFSYFEGEILPGDSVIDYGTGTGLTAPAFLNKGLDVFLIDIAPNSLNDEIKNLLTLCKDNLHFFQAPLWILTEEVKGVDWAYCCDVLEHIPKEKLDISLSNIAKRTKKGGFFQIFLTEETFGDLIEENLHPSIHNHDWWTEKLSTYFPIYATLSIIEGIRSGFFLGPGYEI